MYSSGTGLVPERSNDDTYPALRELTKPVERMEEWIGQGNALWWCSDGDDQGDKDMISPALADQERLYSRGGIWIESWINE